MPQTRVSVFRANSLVPGGSLESGPIRRCARLESSSNAHANLPALEAALAALDAEGCEFVVHTGDAIGIGPHPAECLDLLLA